MLVRVAFLEKRLAKFEHLVNALYCSYYWYCKGVYLVVPLISSEFGLICVIGVILILIPNHVQCNERVHVWLYCCINSQINFLLCTESKKPSDELWRSE